MAYHSSEHVVSRGVQVQITDGCLKELSELSSELSRCVICNRAISKGDYALEHQLYITSDSASGDGEEEKVERVRTVPRVWCFGCSIANAKQLRLPRPKSRPMSTMLAQWRRTQEQLSGGPPPAATVSDEEVEVAVRVVQMRHPEFGAKRVAAALRERLGMTLSEKRAKKWMALPIFAGGAMCKVGTVFVGSPAEAAGLVQDDVLVLLGAAGSGRNYVDVATSVVPEIHEGVPVVATILRSTAPAPVSITLTPGRWGGGGLLGCVLKEMDDE